eukprot:TRINITY_DN26738_c0_g1_i1.p1 TRINITY_DN26738_c0_g1~~TRINITY_DN26738_c0_g1_i1.p1  ORF type:complete len:633 (+),score=87.44 TRINITY_DN26738_c0_g1_i1:162-1901(+)
MLVKRARTEEAQELMLVASSLASLTFASLESAALSTDSMGTRPAAVANWRIIAMFVPLLMQWRLGPAIVYAVMLIIKDLLIAWLMAALHGEAEQASANRLINMAVVSILIYGTYPAFLGCARETYFAEVQLQEEKEALRSLLSVQCDAVVSLDGNRVITSAGMDAVMGEHMIGLKFQECLNEADQERIEFAFTAARSQKQAMLFRSEVCSRQSGFGEQPVDVFVVYRRSGFLIGLSCVGERLPPLVNGSAIASASHISDSDSWSECAPAPSFAADSEFVFDNAIEQQSIETILAMAKHEHWLIQGQSLDFKSSEVLGKGGFGSVVSASFYGSEVAVKSAHPASKTKHALKSMLLELRMLRHLRHPHITGFIGAVVDVTHLRVSLVLELSNGGTLLDAVKAVDFKNLRCIHQELLHECLIGVSSGLYYMHNLTRPMVHRDVKPNNVLIDLSTEGMHAKLSDFGLSHLTSTDKVSTGGSWRWMAPEVLLMKTITPAADVFAFGRLIFFVTVGEMPLPDFTSNALKRHAKDGQVPALAWPEDLPFSGVKQLAEKCTSFEADDRITAKDIWSELSLRCTRHEL